MKQLQLKDVMQRLTIIVHESGFEVSNPAGTAQYDALGARTTVNGIPEYFPLSISVNDNSKRESAELPSGGFTGTVKALPGKITGDVKSVRQLIINLSAQVDTTDLDKLEAQLKRIAELRQGIESPRSFLTREGERRIQEAINKAITKALQQGGSLHKSMRR
ncbi:hypothetical protein [Serratia fonticola]|uniref:hypothetical protein n=1 Tax=Serratia fonticola TaxID=47917 RepID=UPI000E2B62E1|nr:hypothetical protein [Serratia fonticola]RDL25102.1 hypothetical protein DFO62_10634 [Serratia fonticola]